jgi:phenylalanyl-tRNA synthetase beta chain
MIVTKAWLNEFLDLSKVSTEQICKTLNAIGLEVDSLNSVKIPSKVVVGKVLKCEKHPDADKLNVCQVDIGSEVKQIVCGAKNVAEGQMIAAAVKGADLGNGFIIKDATLRGVDSFGMICGSSEIALPKLNDGIWVLDESIGELELGKELSEYPLINDDIIEIELTANRGDCLSIYGVARDLSAALDIPLKEINKIEAQSEISEKDSSLSYMEVNGIKSTDALMELRLGWCELYSDKNITRVLNYAIHESGVILRAYDIFPSKIEVREDENSLDAVYFDDKLSSIIGISQVLKFSESQNYLIEASYIDPDIISEKVMGLEIEKDDWFYNSSRGSESDLLFGLATFAKYVDESQVKSVQLPSKYSTTINITSERIDNFIGQSVETSKVVNILEKLRFDIKEEGGELEIKVPTFRHDVKNQQDIIEEIVRIVGIDNISSSALEFIEKPKINDSFLNYKKKEFFTYKAVGAGYFESIHYFFDSLELMQKYNIPTVKKELDITNPITKDLNTLRTTLLLHLLNSVSSNMKFGKKSVKLFEIGRVVDANRGESTKISFIFSGEVESASISNSGKPKMIDFLTFASSVGGVIGDIKLLPSVTCSNLSNPYESADILIDDKVVGFMSRVHIKIEDDFDLPATYICELDFDSLKFEKILAKDYSKFPSLSRDLSLLVDKSMPFSKIRTFLNSVVAKEIKGFYPIDMYESDELGDRYSLTVKFTLQSDEKTMQEEDISKIMDDILSSLKDELDVSIR